MGVEVQVVKKTSGEYARAKDPPPCPSVTLDGRQISRDGVVTYEALAAAVRGVAP